MSINNTTNTNTCGCCRAAAAPIPQEIWNRPGLPAISYRIGTFAGFRQTMLQAISTAKVKVDNEEFRPLLNWTTRDKDDYGIAVLEMWAYLADVLTFYQERIANEAFLETALLSDSVRRLAALINYMPAPGVAATVNLAFETEKEQQVLIPVPLLVQSVPGQDESPLKFETVQELAAEAWLNKLRIFPEPKDFHALREGSIGGVLTSDPNELTVGDNLVLFETGAELLIDSADILPVVEEKQVDSLLEQDGKMHLEWSPPVRKNRQTCRRFVRKFRLFGVRAPEWCTEVTAVDYTPPDAWDFPWSPPLQIFNWNQDPTDFALATGVSKIELDLDGVYDDLKPGIEVLVVIDECSIGSSGFFSVVARTPIRKIDLVTASCPPLSGPATRITLDDDLLRGLTFDIRDVTVFELKGSEVTFREWEYENLICGDAFYMIRDGIGSLEPDRLLILNDAQEEPQVVRIASVSEAKWNHTKVTFTPELANCLETLSAELYGNVVKATHGETIREEILGSGDSSLRFQEFNLKKPLTTFVPDAESPGGAGNTLNVRVNGVLWQEVADLYGCGPKDRVYVTRVDDKGSMKVRFGDGKTGSPLPSGTDNVTAQYRQGLGYEGNVSENSITKLIDRPLGLKGVNNPIVAEGGTDPESYRETRINAPKSIQTFDRVISLIDFENAAREFIGIAKARAIWKWDGVEQMVCLTVARDEGKQMGADVKANLIGYLNARRDLNRKMQINDHTKIPARIEAEIKIDSAYVSEDVRAAAHEALVYFFDFSNLNLGQSIYLSDVYTVIQSVDGVIGVDINGFRMKTADDVESGVQLWHSLRILPSELAWIENPAEDAIVNIGMEKS